MITVHISGGIGNQLFQYAAGRALADKVHTDLALDLWIYSNIGTNNKRFFQLNNYGISCLKTRNPYIDYIFHVIRIHFPKLFKQSVFSEKSFEYDPSIEKCKNNTYLLGHWQSPKYFSKISSKIKRELSYASPLDSEYRIIAKLINHNNSCFIHVRRGDYISNRQFNATHGTCSLEYYQKAIELLSSKARDPYFFIFSDDISWCKNNLVIVNKHKFVELSKSDDLQELELMKRCKHAIIANSSFSWWSAWLGKSNNRIIIAPKRWFNDENINTDDLIPPNWIRI